MRDLCSHPGLFLVDRLAVQFVASNPCSAVYWVGCTGRSQAEVEEELGKRGGSGGLRFGDG